MMRTILNQWPNFPFAERPPESWSPLPRSPFLASFRVALTIRELVGSPPTPLRGVLAIQPTLFRGEHVPVVDCAHGY